MWTKNCRKIQFSNKNILLECENKGLSSCSFLSNERDIFLLSINGFGHFNILIKLFVVVVVDFGIISGTQMPEYDCAFKYNSSHAASGWFHSPNFPGAYPRYIVSPFNSIQCFLYYFWNFI